MMVSPLESFILQILLQICLSLVKVTRSRIIDLFPLALLSYLITSHCYSENHITPSPLEAPDVICRLYIDT